MIKGQGGFYKQGRTHTRTYKKGAELNLRLFINLNAGNIMLRFCLLHSQGSSLDQP